MPQKICTKDFADSDRWSYIDYNRCGMPLMEIVSEPDIRTPAEAYEYLIRAKADFGVHRGERLQYGGRVAAVRRECERAIARARRNSEAKWK